MRKHEISTDRRFTRFVHGQDGSTDAGGITELRNIAVLADTHHIPFCPHNPSGPVANAATLQLAASQPSFFLLETMASDVPWRNEICDEKIKFTNGKMKIPDRRGQVSGRLEKRSGFLCQATRRKDSTAVTFTV